MPGLLVKMGQLQSMKLFYLVLIKKFLEYTYDPV
jgi:hypothetical protein